MEKRVDIAVVVGVARVSRILSSLCSNEHKFIRVCEATLVLVFKSNRATSNPFPMFCGSDGSGHTYIYVFCVLYIIFKYA